MRGWILVSSIAFGAAGCAQRVYLSQPMRETFELGIVDPAAAADGEGGLARAPSRSPADLQYFTSGRIVLEREVQSRSETVADGRIFVRGGRLIERVIVRRGTPGVAVDWGPNFIAVSFAEGTRLVFELTHAADLEAAGVDRVPDGYLGERRPSTSYRLRTGSGPDGEATVPFEGHTYELVSADVPRLRVLRSAWTSDRRARRVLRGRRVDR
jgi:hypothetical protein